MTTHVNHPAAQCWGKQAYQTPQMAWARAARMRERDKHRKRDEDVANPYRCPNCGRWHLGR